MNVHKKLMMQWTRKPLNIALVAVLALTVAVPAADAATINASLKPAFQADLTTTLKLQAGSGSPTFTRATTAYVQDFEGILRPVISGEARFQGARRVQNLLHYTEDFSTFWTPVTLSVTANQTTSPIGTNTADLFTTTGASGHRVVQGGGAINGTSVTYSVWIKGGTATNAKLLIYDASATVTRASQQVVLTTSWQRFSLSTTNLVSGNNHNFYIYIDENDTDGVGATAYVWGAQAEATAGQSNQNPSEYVSQEVLAAPYHGAGVDGVKYFSTMNGNTVTSNVVTAATGPAINSSTAKFALLPGVVGSYFTTPNSTAIQSLTGDIDVDFTVAATTWAAGTNTQIIGNYNQSSGIGGWRVLKVVANTLRLDVNVGGSLLLFSSPSVAANVNGVNYRYRVKRIASTGVVTWYQSTNNGASWTVISGPTAGTAGNIAAPTVPLYVGVSNVSGFEFPGTVSSARVYNGDRDAGGSLVVNFNPNTWTSGSTWTAGTTGEAWTISGGASVFAGTGLWDSAGPFGYLAEGARTNLALQSNALTTTWLGIGSPSATQNVTGPDGVANSAWTLTDNDASAAEYVQQNITLTAATHTQSWYIKKTVGTQSSYPVMLANSNTKLAAATIDTTNGIATVWTAYTGFTVVTSSASCTSASASWWRCQLTFDATAESWVYYAVPAGATSATQSSGILGVSAQGSAVFYGGQVELGSFASSYIPTTTGTATRNADVLSYPTVRNISGSLGTAYAEPAASYTASAWPSATVVQSMILSGNPGVIMYGHTSSLRFYDVTAERTLATFTPTTALSRVATVWGGNVRAVLNGTVGTAQSFDGDIGLGSNLYIGSFTGGLYPWFGTIRGVKVWPKALTTSQLTTMTTSSTATSRAAIPQTTVKAPTKTGLVGAWTFDEGTGTRANDSSGARNTGTLSGTTLPTWTTGKLGKALSFDGSTSYVSSGTSLGMSGDFSGTASAWIKRASGSSGTFQAVFVAGSAATLQSFGLGINGGSDGDVTIQFNGGKGRYSAGGLIPLNTWTHIAVTKTAGAIESTSHLYINGVEVAQAGGQTGTPNFVAGVNNIGKWTSGGYEFNGTIDEVRVYNRALSAAEINALYKSTATAINTSTNTSLTSGLTGLWSFDGKDMNWGVGKGALDRSGNGNNGLFSGMSTSTSPTIGKIGQALSFNGTNGIAVSNAASINHGSGDFSIALWYKDGPTVVDANDLIGKGSGAFNTPGIGWELRSRSGDTKLEFCVNDGLAACPRISVLGLTAKVWRHVVITVSRTNTLSTMYINGVSAGTMAYAPTYTDAYGMTIGYGHDTLLNGKIDDVRLYNRVLSATEAKALYNLGR